jgi:glycosyltransferase involved in cell wall biosynthesis
VRRLQGRRVPGSVRAKTSSFGWPALRYEVDKLLAGRDQRKQERALSKFATRLGVAMARKGFGSATYLYTMLGDVTPLLRSAREKGVKTVTEIYVILSGEAIVARERVQYPGFEKGMAPEALERAYAWLREVIELSDVLVAPSEAVLQDLQANFGAYPSRCKLVPYTVADHWFDIQNTPKVGQILFVGSAVLRKGIHTLGQAAQILGNGQYSFEVVGGVDASVRMHRLTSSLVFHGRIPRADVSRAYGTADVFVLPSLAEGSAEVTYEALAAGIPVVTTAEAGSVVRDGVDGFIVPVSDPAALADRINRIVTDRGLRDRMAKAARDRALQYRWPQYGNRLRAAIEG